MKFRSLSVFLSIAMNFAASAAHAGPTSDAPGIISKIRAEAYRLGLPPDLAAAVGFVETAFDPTRTGAAGEVGLMQVMPTTAAGMGFQGANADLADVDTNILFGGRYLSEAWTLANHDICLTLAKYNAGHDTRTMSTKTAAYCRRALVYLASIRSPLAEGVTISPRESLALHATADPPIPIEQGPHRSENFWAREKEHIRAVDAQLEAAWTRTAERKGRVASLLAPTPSHAGGDGDDR